MNLQHISYQLGELNGKMDRVLVELERFETLEERVGNLERTMARATGWVLGASGAVATIVSVILRLL